jgi:hypothetical protein
MPHSTGSPAGHASSLPWLRLRRARMYIGEEPELRSGLTHLALLLQVQVSGVVRLAKRKVWIEHRSVPRQGPACVRARVVGARNRHLGLSSIKRQTEPL